MQAQLSAVGQNPTAAAVTQAMNALAPYLPAGAVLDPQHLPQATASDTVRPPHTDGNALAAITQRSVLLKAAPSPSAADLAPTEEAPHTPEIIALATELGHNPVTIYNWVHDHIAYVPSYGSLQGAALTLTKRSGNATDTASLLLALLRVSGIHARYAYGTVEIPMPQLQNWLGGVENEVLALRLLAQTRIPSVGIEDGGRFVAAQLEQVWVDAWVDYFPSRGAIHRLGDTWIPLDASYKQHDVTPGLDLAGLAPYDFAGESTELLATGQHDPTASWFTHIDPNALSRSFGDYLGQFRHALAPLPGNTPLFAQRSIRPEVRTQLAASLPYRRIAHGGQNAVLPESLRHYLRVQLYNSSLDRSLERPSLSARVSLASLNTRRLGLGYAGATPEDQARWDSYTQQGATSLPAYLLEVRPQLKLDDVLLAEGSTVRMGSAQLLDLTLEAPYARDPLHYTVTAGDELNLGVNANGVTPTEVQARLRAVPPESSAEQLHQLSLHYWLEHDLMTSIGARALNIQQVRLPSFGVFAAPLTVDSFYGIPVSGSYRSYAVDIHRELMAVVAPTPELLRNYNFRRGIQGSYLEGSVPGQLLLNPPLPGVSTLHLLLDANAKNIRLYAVNQDNRATVLPLLSVSAAVRARVEQALNAGLWVFIPQQAQTLGDWQGSGYLILDPNTGAGAYLIEGGLNGGLLPAACGEGVNPIRVLALNLAIAAVVERFQARGMT